MRKFYSRIALILIASMVFALSSCTAKSNGTKQDTANTINAAATLQSNQPTPTDIDYSLERYNLIRRAYWVNGQREKAISLPCELTKPLGYIVLFSGNAIVGNFVVDVKVTSLNSYLTPDSEWYESGSSNGTRNDWIADIDGSYGANDTGIFFFTPDGKYIEWSGEYLYSDIPMTVENPVVNFQIGE